MQNGSVVCTTVVALSPCLPQWQLHVADGPTPHSVAWMCRSYPCANLEFSRRLSLLRLCRLSSRRIDIPSWVPNLVHPVKGSLPTQNNSGFSCSHAKTLEARILAVQGMSYGVVSTISSPYQPKDRVGCPRHLRHTPSLASHYLLGTVVQRQGGVADQIAYTVSIMEHCKESAPANGGQKPSLEQWKSLFLDATRMEGLEASPELKLSQKIQQLIQSAFVDKQFFLLGSHHPAQKQVRKTHGYYEPILANQNLTFMYR